jgi:hypothetical protein
VIYNQSSTSARAIRMCSITCAMYVCPSTIKISSLYLQKEHITRVRTEPLAFRSEHQTWGTHANKHYVQRHCGSVHLTGTTCDTDLQRDLDCRSQGIVQFFFVICLSPLTSLALDVFFWATPPSSGDPAVRAFTNNPNHRGNA